MKNNPIYEMRIVCTDGEVDYVDPVLKMFIEEDHLLVDNGYGCLYYAWCDIKDWEIRQK